MESHHPEVGCGLLSCSHRHRTNILEKQQVLMHLLGPHSNVVRRFTLKPEAGLGLVGDGVEDLVDLGAEPWLLENPLTGQRTERDNMSLLRS